MSAEKVRNLETMFHMRTTKLADGSTRIYNLSAFNFRAAETDDKKFVLVVSKAAKLSKRLKSFRNKSSIISCQTRDFSSPRLAFLLSYRNTVNLNPRVARQPRRLHGRPRWFIFAEKLGVNIVHRCKIVHIS